MHIVSVNYEFPSVSETFVLNQITGLIRLGHQVTPWSQEEGSWSDTHQDLQRFGLRTRFCSAAKKVSTAGLWKQLVLRRPLQALRVFRKRREIERRGGEKVLRAALTLGAIRDVDVYHCQFGHMGDFALWLRNRGLLENKPVVTTFHGWDIREALTGNIEYPELLAAADPVIAISAYSMDQLKKIGIAGERLVRIPVAVDTEKFVPAEAGNAEPVRILMVARLAPVKNIRLALEALAACRDLAFRFTLVGGGELEEDVRGWVQDLGLGDVVDLVGPKDHEAIVAYLNAADLCMLTSHAENLPVSVMEAGACGVPVVATNVGSIAELILHNESGWLAEAGSVNEVAEGLRQLIADREKRKEFGIRAAEHIRSQFSLERWLEELVNCFQQAAKA